MAVEVKLPRLGQGMEAGTIVRWLKSEGDNVEKGEPLYELDTDKVTQEVESDAGGVLLEIVVADGEVDVGTTIAVIGAEGEDVSRLAAPGDGDGGGPQAAASPPGVESTATMGGETQAEGSTEEPQGQEESQGSSRRRRREMLLRPRRSSYSPLRNGRASLRWLPPGRRPSRLRRSRPGV